MTKRIRRTMLWLTFGAVFIFGLVLALCRVSGDSAEETFVYRTDSEETTLHEQGPIDPMVYADVHLLAKIMRAESGIDWPDWAIMAIGEVVLNRVNSPLFPNTIHGVIYADNPIQYAPVWEEGWRELEPDEDYIELARRLLSGERVFNDPSVIWQALFPQGEKTVMTYHDKALGSTTYFCS